MTIRMLEQKEMLNAMNLVWDVFVKHTAPLYSQEGVETFQSFIKIDSIMDKYYRGEAFLWGAYVGSDLVGVSMMNKLGHICLLDVKTQYQTQGIGTALFEEMQQFCVQTLRLNKIDVNAAPNAIAVYQSLGFMTMSSEQINNGIRFVPMQYVIMQDAIETNQKSQTGLIIGIIAGILLLGVIGIFFISGNIGRLMYSSIVSSSHDYYDDHNDYDDYDDYYDDNLDNGFYSLPRYKADDLYFDIVEEEYSKHEELERGEISINAYYPRLKGLKGDREDEINKIFEDYAMKTANDIFINPNAEVKEAMLQQTDFYIGEFVDCQVLYVNDKVISTLFEKEGFGIHDAEDVLPASVFEMAGITVDLEDGTIYEAKDVLKYDDDFMEEWIEIMREEANGDLRMLEDLSLKEMQDILTGKEMLEGYRSVFFLYEDGIEIGISYPEGCITAPYTWDEVKEHVTDSPLWRLVDQLN